MSSLKTCLLLLVSGLTMGIGAGAHTAWSSDLVSEVSVSSDCRRLIVKTKGRPAIDQIFSMNRPSRLVVDFKNTGFAGTFKKMRYDDQPIREVRVASRGSGTRLVFEFAGHDVPEYRVREIDNHLIILLDAFLPTTTEIRRAEKITETGRRIGGDDHRKGQTLENAAPDGTGLKIKSACVSNGMIVLDVATHDNEDKQFRIDLGVDLKELGFSTVEIRPRKQRVEKRATAIVGKKSSPHRSVRTGHVRGSARLGLGSSRLSKRSGQTGLFDIGKLKRKKSRVARNHVMPVVKECGYRPTQDHLIR